jgi:hypothetical protein
MVAKLFPDESLLPGRQDNVIWIVPRISPLLKIESQIKRRVCDRFCNGKPYRLLREKVEITRRRFYFVL